MRAPSIPLLCPSPSFSPSFSLSYSEHPIPYPMESFLSEQYLFLGAIVQPGITPPVVLDCCERSFFLRSYINRLRSPAKRDPTSSLGSAKAAPATVVLRRSAPPACRSPVPPAPLSRQEESLSSGTTWPGTCIATRIISTHFRMPVYFRPVGPLFPRVFPITVDAAREREREFAVKYYGTNGFMSHVRKG